MVSPATGWIGTTGSNRKEIQQIRVGTAAGTKNVREAWVGTTAGNKRWFIAPIDLVATSSAQSHTQTLVSWSTVHHSATYTVTRLPATVLQSNSFTTYVYDSGLSASTSYSYRVDAIRNGSIVDTATTTVTTPAAPAPPTPPPTPQPVYQDREWIGVATNSASYDGSGNLKQDTRTELYCGYWSSNRGNQKSTWNFSIPGEIRNCTMIHYVHMRVRMLHSYSNSGVNCGVVVHHNSGQGYGSTGTFGSFAVAANGTLDCWLGNGGEYIDITNYTVPGSFGNRNWSVKEEFRAGGATGLGLFNPDASNYHYGYGVGVNYPSSTGFWPAIKIGYRVQIA